MRLGTVQLEYGYVVDLDDQDMVDHAKTAILEDMSHALGFNGALPAGNVSFQIDKDKDNSLSENDIPEFLLDKEPCDDCEREYPSADLDDNGLCVHCATDKVLDNG